MARRHFSRAAITQRLFNTPLAVTAETAAIVLGAVGQRFDVSQLLVASDGQRVTLGELEQLAADERTRISARANVDQRAPFAAAEQLMPVINNVAHVEIRGETVAENGIGPMSGFTGYDGVRAQVLAADADPVVRGILLDVDSPGGEVAGLYECAAALMARRGIKPMRAVIRGVGASAAYALSACADEVTVHDLGYAGSVGTIIMHADFSAALAQDGVKVTLIAAGAHKADGNPFEPLPDAVKARYEQLCADANARFIAHVATARGLTEDAVRAQQAQLYRGQEAVDAGLADKVMNWADSIDEFVAQVNAPASPGAGGTLGRPARPAPGARSSTETTMDKEGAAPAGISPDEHQAAITMATTNAVAAERARIAGLQAVAGVGNQAALDQAIADGTEPGAFAIALRKAEEERAAAALADAQADAASPSILPAKAAQPNPGEKVNRGAAYMSKKTAA